LKNPRVVERKRLEKLEKKRIKRNKERKRLRLANEAFVNLAVYKLKKKQSESVVSV
jgi:hypothetical protein